MGSGRSLQDRLLRRLAPRPVVGFAPPPQAVGEGLWELERRLVHFGVAQLPSRTSIVRLGDGSLVVISAPPADAAGVEAIGALGRVAQVVVPSSFHYLFAADFAGRCTGASVLAAPGVRTRVPGLRVDAELGAESPSGWAGVLEHVALGPTAQGTCEVLFFHVPSATLILTDLAFHMTTYPRAIDRWTWRASGLPRGFGPGRTTRALLLADRTAASRALARAMEWPFARIAVGHGEVVERDARALFGRAFERWLRGATVPG